MPIKCQREHKKEHKKERKRKREKEKEKEYKHTQEDYDYYYEFKNKKNRCNRHIKYDSEGEECYDSSLINYSCENEKCDHKMTTVITPVKFNYIKSIDQLIELGESFHCKKNKQEGNINLRVLCILIPVLIKIKNMIGLIEVKDRIIDQILYFVQGNHNNGYTCGECRDCELNIPCMKTGLKYTPQVSLPATDSCSLSKSVSNFIILLNASNVNESKQNADKTEIIHCDMLHTCITGNPGCGKTELGKLLAELYYTIGILPTKHFNIFRRSDLVGEFLGQTAVKTQKCIDKSLGGVMFIDEAYSLGNDEKRDSFSKECIDTLTQNLSENRNFICIIAGYKEQIDKCFFAYNEGLNRRFAFRYHINNYTAKELKQIFELKVKLGKYQLYNEVNEEKEKAKEKAINELFTNNYKYFANGGGDMETLFLNVKIVHGRNLTHTKEMKYIITLTDIQSGIEMLVSNRDIKDKDTDTSYTHMYL